MESKWGSNQINNQIKNKKHVKKYVKKTDPQSVEGWLSTPS